MRLIQIKRGYSNADPPDLPNRPTNSYCCSCMPLGRGWSCIMRRQLKDSQRQATRRTASQTPRGSHRSRCRCHLQGAVWPLSALPVLHSIEVKFETHLREVPSSDDMMRMCIFNDSPSPVLNNRLPRKPSYIGPDANLLTCADFKRDSSVSYKRAAPDAGVGVEDITPPRKPLSDAVKAHRKANAKQSEELIESLKNLSAMSFFKPRNT